MKKALVVLLLLFGGLDPMLTFEGETFNKDQSYLCIAPAVKFKASSNSWFELGATINKDMGDAAAAGSSDQGMSFGAFAVVKMNF